MVSVGVTIPLYNKRQTVRRAVLSVLRQTFGDFELVIVDDGSTDDGLEAIDDLKDDRIRIERQTNQGPGAARNRGAASTGAEFLAFLDADDEWEPDFLATAVARLHSHPACDAHVCGYFDGPDRKSAEPANRAAGIRGGPWRAPGDLSPTATKRFVDFLHSSCIVARRPAFDGYRGFYEKNRCLYGEDSYLWLMFVMNNELYLDPGPGVWFHTESSALGKARVGRHPRRPALLEPEPLRSQCRPGSRQMLEELLAYYRLLETEALVKRSEWGEVEQLRRNFEWPRGIPRSMLTRELKVTAKVMKRRLADALSAPRAS